MLNTHLNRLAELERLDFTGKAEAFVEQKFLTPLLECLGYESHRDYEAIRHGDDGSLFKLRYVPALSGGKKDRRYNPHFIPTIRKKAFWIIEAKSPKDVPYPFDGTFLVQGFQYCIHPEIQAKYLIVSNGLHTVVYDTHGTAFLDRDLYDPLLEFESTQLLEVWDELYELLSIETLRTRIEKDIKEMYDKLCLSSLDESYPRFLLQRIGASLLENAELIQSVSENWRWTS
jgi:hypothetical protein